MQREGKDGGKTEGRFEETKARQGIVITSFLQVSSQANGNGEMQCCKY